MNQIDNVVQDDKSTLKNNERKPSTSKKLPSQQVASSEFSFPTHLTFHVTTERQNKIILRMLSALLKLSYTFQHILYNLKNTVLIVIQIL